jgi:hypothetical protein
VRLKGGLVQTPAAVGKTAAYETFFVDEPGGALRTEPGVALTPPLLLSDLAVILHLGAAGRAARRNGSRYQAAGNPVRVAEPAFVLADRSTMAAADSASAPGTTFSDMHALLAGRRNLQIVATHEMTVN